MQLKGKNIVVTGAASGIGRGCAEEFSRLGANLLLIDMNADKLRETASQLPLDSWHICASDVRDTDKLADCISAFTTSYGPADGMLYAAGIQYTLPFRSMKADIYREIYDINVVQAFELSRLLTARKNFNANGGSLVYIASVMAVKGAPGLVGYCASKGALISGARSLALELANRKIRVNTVSPGYVQTEMMLQVQKDLSDEEMQAMQAKFPLGLAVPQNIADLCSFLLSDRASWVTGQNHIIDGGFSA